MDAGDLFCIDIASFNLKKNGQRVCGDTVLYKKIHEENRWILVLSDGLGSGVKANVLSTLTATMALRYTEGFHDIKKSAETIMRTLPVCSERKISYATFTIVDIDSKGSARIINYDNPPPVLIRGNKPVAIPVVFTEGKVKTRNYRLAFSSIQLTTGDRLALFSDGVTQAGTGSDPYPLGWGNREAETALTKAIAGEADLSARILSRHMVSTACGVDKYIPHDDITCAIVHCRTPQKLLVASGPPVDKGKDAQMAGLIDSFDGATILCGGTTAKIFAREKNKKIGFDREDLKSPLPPQSHIDGIDLVTEGIITLNNVAELLQSGMPLEQMEKSAAKSIIELMLDSDSIEFLVGTRINEAWEDPALPNEINLRRTIVARIIQLLRQKFGKMAHLTII